MTNAVTKNHKLHYGKTMLIGFGFMAVQVAWTIYNAYVPLILRENPAISNLKIAGTAVGLIMVIDNVFGVIFQPLFGRFSDKTRTRFGKRTPYMLVGIPICALLFILIPKFSVLWMLMADIIFFNFIMSTWRSPVVALMPDMVPSELRGEGNAVINIMGGVGVVIATVAGKIVEFFAKGTLSALATEAEKTQFLRGRVFLLGSIVMFIDLCVVTFFVREPDNRLSKLDVAEAKQRLEKSKNKLKLTKSEKLSLFLILLALFFNSNATDSISTYATTFMKYEMGFKEQNASLIIALFAAATVIGAIPAGKLGQKIGRKKTISIGWIIILSLFLIFYFTKLQFMLYVAIVFGGIAISFATINTLPLVLELGGEDKVGTYTGYYYTATFAASIVGPVVVGGIFDLTKKISSTGKPNYWALFVFAPVCFGLALACLSGVKGGETGDTAKALTE